MSEREPKRKSGIGRGVLTALCAVSLALTVLSGCSVTVVNSQRNPFLGEWHADYTSVGSRFSAEYEFFGNSRYTYVRQSAGGVVEITVRTRGAYQYDGEILTLTPDASDVGPSRFEYEFTSDDALRLKEQISPSVTLTLTYHRHS